MDAMTPARLVVADSPISPEPECLIPEIDRLVSKASMLDIDPSRIRIYARLLAAAEDEKQWETVGDEQSRRSTHEIWGELHGFTDGYRNPEHAAQIYRRGRKARQAVHASARGACLRTARLVKVFETNYADLPVHIQIMFPLQSVSNLLESLHDLRRSTRCSTLKRESQEKSLPVKTLVYLWWRHSVADYRGKWADMHRLAIVWRQTEADLANFRRYVRKISSGVTDMPASPPWATPKQ